MVTELEMNAPQKFERLDQEMQWYATNADRKQRAFYRLTSFQILLGISIPICSLVSPDPSIANIINGVMGSGIAALEAFLRLFDAERYWQRWRSAAESLKREKWLFLQRAGPYADPAAPKSADILLAERVEGIIAREQEEWAATRDDKCKR